MAKIVIRGQSQNITKEEAKEALSFFSDHLLGRASQQEYPNFSYIRS